jgi:hypothetical protein
VVPGPAARILSPSPIATNGTARATRREAGLLVLSAGPLAYPYGAAHRQVVASWLDSARVPSAVPTEGPKASGSPTQVENNRSAGRRGESVRDHGSRAFDRATHATQPHDSTVPATPTPDGQGARAVRTTVVREDQKLHRRRHVCVSGTAGELPCGAGLLWCGGHGNRLSALLTGKSPEKREELGAH